MSPPWDVWGVGCAMGGAAGLLLGYQVRKLFERVVRREVQPERPPERRAKPKPATIPLDIPPNQRATFQWVSHPEPSNPWRDDVIAALMGSGYKKADAIKAADACSMVEQHAGLEQWIVAALRNAHGAK